MENFSSCKTTLTNKKYLYLIEFGYDYCFITRSLKEDSVKCNFVKIIKNNVYFNKMYFLEIKDFIYNFLYTLNYCDNDISFYYCNYIENNLRNFLKNYIVISDATIALCNENILDVINNNRGFFEVINIKTYETIGYIYVCDNCIDLNLSDIYAKQCLNLVSYIIFYDNYDIKVNNKIYKKKYSDT